MKGATVLLLPGGVKYLETRVSPYDRSTGLGAKPVTEAEAVVHAETQASLRVVPVTRSRNWK